LTIKKKYDIINIESERSAIGEQSSKGVTYGKMGLRESRLGSYDEAAICRKRTLGKRKKKKKALDN
jgi:hypothetical protein